LRARQNLCGRDHVRVSRQRLTVAVVPEDPSSGKNAMKTAAVLMLFVGFAFGQAKKDVPPVISGLACAKNTMDEVYLDQTHCLASPEIRGDKDAPISCFCRDAIAEARYVYFTYILSGKDTVAISLAIVA